MTVSSLVLRNDYQGNGTQTAFDFTIQALRETNQLGSEFATIKVIVTDSNGVETTKTEDVDYTITLDEDTRNGTVTFTTAPLASEKITFLSNIPFTQQTDYINIGTDKFPADSHERTVDKLTLIAQQQEEAINRAILLPESSELTNVTIPVSTANAGKVIVVNGDGNDLTTAELADLGSAAVSTYIKTLLDDETAAEARNTLDAEQKINSLIAITSLQDADQFIVADNSDSNNSKKIIKSDLAKSLINGLGAETSLQDADQVAFADNSDSDSSKKITIANLKTEIAGLQLIATADASNSTTVDFDNFLDGTYNAYKVVISGLVPTTDNSFLYMRVGTGATPTYQSSGYRVSTFIITDTGGSIGSGSSPANQWEFANTRGVGSTSGESMSVEIDVFNPSSTSLYKLMKSLGYQWSSDNNTQTFVSGGTWDSLTAVTSLRFLMSAGNIASGEFALYGIKKS